MRDFFRGWRRKMGCAVLLMACGLMGLWLRNFREPDYFTYTRSSRHYAIHLAAGTVIWSEFTPDRCGPIDIWSREFRYSRYVIPFTLLSAHLILWKPRRRTTTSIDLVQSKATLPQGQEPGPFASQGSSAMESARKQTISGGLKGRPFRA